MLYFAYGSNMDPEQMQARSPNYKVVGLATLREYALVFPHYSNEWKSGVAGVQPHHGDQVWGVLYEVGEESVERLDQLYGYRGTGDQHNVYDREQVTVELTRPDDGSFARRIRAWMYVARPSNPSPPSREYLDALIRGARHHQLPEEYIAMLGGVEVAAEPKPG